MSGWCAKPWSWVAYCLHGFRCEILRNWLFFYVLILYSTDDIRLDFHPMSCSKCHMLGYLPSRATFQICAVLPSFGVVLSPIAYTHAYSSDGASISPVGALDEGRACVYIE